MRAFPRHRGTLSWAVVAAIVAVLLVPAARPAAAAGADQAPPATIRVCRNVYGGGEVVEVGFREYVKTVLPYEFDATYGEPYREYFRAGAVAVKSYAWWWVNHPYSDECHITDGGQHQHYNPGQSRNPRNATTDRAVDDTWFVRYEDGDTGGIAFTQYCSCRHFPAGRHIQQQDARGQAAEGADWQAILGHAYRDLPGVVTDWRDGLGVGLPDGPVAFGADDELRITAAVAGVAPGDDRVVVDLRTVCTIDGRRGSHRVGVVGISADADGRPVARFDDTSVIDACVEDEVGVTATMLVNGHAAGQDVVEAWRPWTARQPRDVTRVADTPDVVAATIAISQALFDDAGTGSEGAGSSPDDGSLTGDLLGEDAQQDAEPAQTAAERTADHVVVARKGTFADALSATALAGTGAPILLTPGADLHPDVRAEIGRVLPEGRTVFLVGGPEALDPSVAEELEADGYEVRRLHGADRVATALRVADDLHRQGRATGTVLVARAFPDTSAGWADAVTAGAYAAATSHPVLLTGTESLDAEVEAWIEDPNRGIDEVVLLGGPAAVPADAESRLDGVTVTRVAGAERTATAVAVADALWSRADAPEVRRAVVVNVFDDDAWGFAIAGAVYAARLGAPQLGTAALVPRASTGSWLDDRAALPVSVLGARDTVSERAVRQLAGG